MHSDEDRTTTRDQDIGSSEIDASLADTLHLLSIELYPRLELFDDLVVETCLPIVCVYVGRARLFHGGIIWESKKKKGKILFRCRIKFTFKNLLGHHGSMYSLA